MLIGFPLIFVAYTHTKKMFYGYKFVAPLIDASANFLHYVLGSFVKLDCVSDGVRKSPISKVELLDFVLQIEKIVIAVYFCFQIMKLYC